MRNSNTLMMSALLFAGVAAAAFWTPKASFMRRADALVGSFAQADTWRPTPPPVPAQLQLHGSVIDMGNATSGIATLRVGTAVSSTPVSLPAYSLQVGTSQPDEMVSIEIEAPGYRYASTLGSYRKLAANAGVDAQLTVAELDRLRLSPFSTALYFLVSRELEGRAPLSDFEHEQAIRAVYGFDVLTASNALEAFATQALPLPSGYANGYALMQDQAGYSAFVSENNNQLTSGEDAYFQRAPSIAMTAEELGANLVLTGPIERKEPQVIPASVRLLIPAGLGYHVHANYLQRNSDYAKAIIDGDLQLTPLNETIVGVFYEIRMIGGTPTSVRRVTTLLGSTYRRLFVGAQHSLWADISEFRVNYPDYPELEDFTFRNAAQWTATALNYSPLPTWRKLGGLHALPVFCRTTAPVAVAQCNYGLHRLLPGGLGSTEEIGPKTNDNMQPVAATGGEVFQWETAGGAPLSIHLGSIEVKYWPLKAGDQASDFVVYLASTTDAADTITLAGSATMLHADGGAGFAQLTPPGTWRYGTVEQFLFPYGGHDSVQPTIWMVHDWRGTSLQTFRWPGEYSDLDYNVRSGWQTNDGRMYDTRYRANVSTGIPATIGFSSCMQAAARGATQCAPQRIRYFQPIATVGSKLYGIEEISVVLATDYTPPFEISRSIRPSYFERLP